MQPTPVSSHAGSADFEIDFGSSCTFTGLGSNHSVQAILAQAASSTRFDSNSFHSNRFDSYCSEFLVLSVKLGGSQFESGSFLLSSSVDNHGLAISLPTNGVLINLLLDLTICKSINVGVRLNGGLVCLWILKTPQLNLILAMPKH